MTFSLSRYTYDIIAVSLQWIPANLTSRSIFTTIIKLENVTASIRSEAETHERLAGRGSRGHRRAKEERKQTSGGGFQHPQGIRNG